MWTFPKDSYQQNVITKSLRPHCGHIQRHFILQGHRWTNVKIHISVTGSFINTWFSGGERKCIFFQTHRLSSPFFCAGVCLFIYVMSLSRYILVVDFLSLRTLYSVFISVSEGSLVWKEFIDMYKHISPNLFICLENPWGLCCIIMVLVKKIGLFENWRNSVETNGIHSKYWEWVWLK